MTKAILSAFIAVVFSFSHNSFTCERANKSERFIFIGNPGVGKSTLINSLIGQEVAVAGISGGVGLTKFFSEYRHDGKWYMDTPGLADTKLREQAARKIEKALKQNDDYI